MSIAILLFSFLSCGGSKTSEGYTLQKEAPFTVVKASSQKWIAGTPEGGSGLNFNFQIKDQQGDIEFGDIYFQEKMTRVIPSRILNHYQGYFVNVMKNDKTMDINPANEMGNTPPVKIPFKLSKDEAIISYKVNGTMQYFKLKKVKEMPVLAYPKNNPNGID